MLRTLAPFCLLGSLVMPQFAVAQISDTTPPTLVGLSFTPAVDVTAGNAIVTVTAHVTDDLAGVSSGNQAAVGLTFRSPSRAQSMSLFPRRISGSALDGIYQGGLSIPQFSESGVWKLDSLLLVDLANNRITLSTGNLQTLGFPTDLTVTSIPDTQPPQISRITINPVTTDVSASAQNVILTLNLTDNLSGVSFINDSVFLGFGATFSSPSGKQRRFTLRSQFSLVSGTNVTGDWQATIQIPQYSEPGIWKLAELVLRDGAGNIVRPTTAALAAAGLSTDLDVSSSPADITAPQIQDLSFIPNIVDTSLDAETVTVTLSITDDLAGTDFSPDTSANTNYHGLMFTSPSGRQVIRCCLQPPTFSLLSGSSLNGTWQKSFTFPQFSEAGTWKASIVQVKDAAGNLTDLSSANLAAMGFPTGVVVYRPSQVSDGSVGPSGGTVIDQTFGPRAQITFPSGALSSNTQIALDVFPSPLEIPTPAGFQGPGTLFMNVSLNPAPLLPFSPPGVGLVLPLAQLMTTGARIDLYYVNRATGALVPMLDTSGLPVVGIVDPSGLAATFEGISHFTVVVGLIPVPVAATPPVVTAAISPAPNAMGWHNTNATVAFTATDTGGIGVKETVYSVNGEAPIVTPGASAAVSFSVDGQYSVTYYAEDNAGNQSLPQSVTIKLDQTPPSIAAALSPAANAAGWNNSNVVVDFTCFDNLSGVTTCESDHTITSEGTTTVTGSVMDAAGNVANYTYPVPVKIDKTAPTITGLPAVACSMWPPNHAMLTVATVLADDGLSGVLGGSFNISGTSNEPENGLGDGDTGPDISITYVNPKNVALRAERSGRGTGRVYSLTATVTDQGGNSTTVTSNCTVPRDQR